MQTVGADDEATGVRRLRRPHFARPHLLDPLAPQEVDTHLCGARDERGVELGATDAAAGAGLATGEIRLGDDAVGDVADPPERHRPGRRRDAEHRERRDARRHQTLAASLVDRRPLAIDHAHRESVGARRDRGREPHRPATHHDDVGRRARRERRPRRQPRAGAVRPAHLRGLGSPAEAEGNDIGGGKRRKWARKIPVRARNPASATRSTPNP